MINKMDEKHQHQAGFETRSEWNQSVASNNTQTEMLVANHTEANALKGLLLFIDLIKFQAFKAIYFFKIKNYLPESTF